MTTTMTSTVTGVAIAADGTVTDVTLNRESDGSVSADLRTAIGCRWFDCVELVADGTASIDAWINDEGRYDDPPNRLATLVAATLAESPCTMLHGTVLFTSNDRDSGETTSLASESVDDIKFLAGLAAD